MGPSLLLYDFEPPEATSAYEGFAIADYSASAWLITSFIFSIMIGVFILSLFTAVVVTSALYRYSVVVITLSRSAKTKAVNPSRSRLEGAWTPKPINIPLSFVLRSLPPRISISRSSAGALYVAL